jgi:hypothetical protein
MSFEYNGETWTPETTQQHATAWMEKINSLLEENNVRDKDGNIIKLSQNFASALYLQVLAGSNRLSVNDEKLQLAINSFNIELCTDQQIENLLPIASITRNPGSYSTLVLTATASADGDCYIPAGTKAPFENANFVVTTNILIPAGETQNIDTVCDTVGAFAVLTGEITAFDTQIPNLETLINNVSSIPGTAAETTASLRQRILKGNTIPYSLDGVETELETLTGINHARVYFNYNTDTTLTLSGGIVLQPRTAYIVINGESEKLAKTYARYMSAPTQNAPNASPTGTYTTVNVLVTTPADNSATVPAYTSFKYSGMVFTITEDVICPANDTTTIEFTAVAVGAVVIPAGEITQFDQDVTNIINITNQESTPGVDKTAYTQNYVTASGQLIPIKYDTASNQTIFVRVTLEAGAEDGSQIRNQIRRDLISSAASWKLGDSISSLITGAVFKNCLYTKVAYTQVSIDGENWGNYVTVDANAMPLVYDNTISIEVMSL